MSKTTVSNYLLGGTNRARHPATQGSEWSCNMFLETSGKNTYLASVPGLQHYRSIGSGRCRGAYTSSIGKHGDPEEAFVVFGNVLYRIDYTENVERLGYVASGSSRVTFAETGGLRPFLLVADGTNLWCYNILEGGELTRIPLPARVTGDGDVIKPTHVAVISGSIVVNDSGTGFCYYSIPYPIQKDTREVYHIENGQVIYTDDTRLQVETIEVNSLDYVFFDDDGATLTFNAQTNSDAIQAIAAVGSHLYLFGTKTVEIWQRGNGDGETWVKTSYTTNASNGIQCPYSIAICGSTLYYLGSGESYAKGIMKVDGNTYTKISDDWLEAKLLQERSDTVYAFAYALGSHNFYVLQLPTVGETWVYDTDTNEWHQRTSRDKISGVEIQWRVAAMLWFNGRFFAFCHDGNAYLHSEDWWYEDYGTEKSIPMTRHRQGAVIVNENAPFVFNELAVECNVGHWDGAYRLSPKLLLEVSNDGGNTFGNVRSCSMGHEGQYSHRVRYHNLGINRLCVLRLTYSHPTALELTSVSERITPTGRMI